MRILAIASASGGCSAALVENDRVLAAAHIAAAQGMSDRIAGMLAELWKQASPVEAVAVVVGPGSFTGLRAGIAAGTGIAIAAGLPSIGVTVAEAIAHALPQLGSRELWVATEARTGHVVLDRAGVQTIWVLHSVPSPAGPVAIAGDAANGVAALLAARGANVMLTSARRPLPRHVAAVAESRLRGDILPCPALPLYPEPPLVSRQSAARRPSPQ